MEDEVYNYEATMSPLAAIAMGRIQKVISEEEFDAFVEKNEELYQSPIRAMMLFAAEATKSYHFLQAHLEANDLKLIIQSLMIDTKLGLHYCGIPKMINFRPEPPKVVAMALRFMMELTDEISPR